MGIFVSRRVAELGDSLVLAPERYDPRRLVRARGGRCLGELAELVTESIKSCALPDRRLVLVLDTTHAYEGFVIHRHPPVRLPEMGSAKRRVQPGDVIISRLRPYLRQVAYVDEPLFRLAPEGNDVCVSSEFFVLRGRGRFDAAALVPFLLAEPVQAALAAGQEGGHHPRFSSELLASLRVPQAVVRAHRRTADAVRAHATAVREAFLGGRALVARAERRMSE
jgi:hypothetical protein